MRGRGRGGSCSADMEKPEKVSEYWGICAKLRKKCLNPYGHHKMWKSEKTGCYGNHLCGTCMRMVIVSDHMNCGLSIHCVGLLLVVKLLEIQDLFHTSGWTLTIVGWAEGWYSCIFIRKSRSSGEWWTVLSVYSEVAACIQFPKNLECFWPAYFSIEVNFFLVLVLKANTDIITKYLGMIFLLCYFTPRFSSWITAVE